MPPESTHRQSAPPESAGVHAPPLPARGAGAPPSAAAAAAGAPPVPAETTPPENSKTVGSAPVARPSVAAPTDSLRALVPDSVHTPRAPGATAASAPPPPSPENSVSARAALITAHNLVGLKPLALAATPTGLQSLHRLASGRSCAAHGPH